jgi:hypothetical protein
VRPSRLVEAQHLAEAHRAPGQLELPVPLQLVAQLRR